MKSADFVQERDKVADRTWYWSL